MILAEALFFGLSSHALWRLHNPATRARSRARTELLRATPTCHGAKLPAKDTWQHFALLRSMGACGAMSTLSRSVEPAQHVTAQQIVRTPLKSCPGRKLRRMRPWPTVVEASGLGAPKGPRLTHHVMTALIRKAIFRTIPVRQCSITWKERERLLMILNERSLPQAWMAYRIASTDVSVSIIRHTHERSQIVFYSSFRPFFFFFGIGSCGRAPARS